jgi:hypothetical protein
VIIWCAAEPEKLPEKVAEELKSDQNELIALDPTFFCFKMSDVKNCLYSTIL